jgi:hypothetical protein
MRQIKRQIITIAVAFLTMSAFSNSGAIAQAPQMSEEKTALYTKYEIIGAVLTKPRPE